MNERRDSEVGSSKPRGLLRSARNWALCARNALVVACVGALACESDHLEDAAAGSPSSGVSSLPSPPAASTQSPEGTAPSDVAPAACAAPQPTLPESTVSSPLSSSPTTEGMHSASPSTNTTAPPQQPPTSSALPSSDASSVAAPTDGTPPSEALATEANPSQADGGESGGAEEDEPPTAELDAPALQPAAEPISFGTTLDPAAVMSDARELARNQLDPSSDMWRATGDQHRVYHFGAANADEPYRLYVPTHWDGASRLPLVMFLHGAGSDENTYVDQNGQQMLALAEEHGFLLVSPLGVSGAYGSFLRLSAPFGDPQGTAELVAQVTDESMRVNELSETSVINALELVLAEYPIDYTSMFLTGHSMGSGGTWYIGGKYSTYWRAIAPMSGPFVQETGYPWENLRPVVIFVTEGTQTPSLEGSQLLAQWLTDNAFDSRYLEVDADHGGMVPLVLPDVFTFFEESIGG